jgi:redox-sensitive bicupin YhaK (pirin superfamily)
MSEHRSVSRVLTGIPTIEGAGVHLQRVFGAGEIPRFDPFLLLDDFGSSDPEDYIAGFPWHPHRGIETVTYMLSGTVEHGDSLGNSGRIGGGDVQWMTAGSGIVHQEMPQAGDEPLRGFQLWINLPAAEKMGRPLYRDITSAEIPEISPRPGQRILVIAGEIAGKRGPVVEHTVDPLYLDVTLEPGIAFELETPRDHTAFAYAIAGSGEVGPPSENRLTIGQLALLGPGELVRAVAAEDGLRFLLVCGRPLGEPVAWGGPIVMNTRDELAQAFRELKDGSFLKHEAN